MATTLRSDLKQSKPFSSPEQEAFLNLARTAALLEHRFGDLLKEHGITTTQYNVLRILRGAGPDGLTRNEVRERLIAEVPDATRLLDRLMEMDLITRIRNDDDRRCVTARITTQGLELLARLDQPVIDAHREHFAILSWEELATLSRLLEKIRNGISEIY